MILMKFIDYDINGGSLLFTSTAINKAVAFSSALSCMYHYNLVI